MIFKIGIIGLPNAGKSTFFSLLTNRLGLIKSYPFSTIKPNYNSISIVDERLEFLSKISNSKKITYSKVDIFDTAGLLKGASRGEGLGNQFLADIQRVDALIHVVRCFHDQRISHVMNEINPLDDIEIIKIEMILFDLNILKKSYLSYKKQYKNKLLLNSSNQLETLKIIEKSIFYLEKTVLLLRSKQDDILRNKFIKSLNLLTLKPIVYLFNRDNDFCVKNKKYLSSINSFKEEKIYINLQKKYNQLNSDNNNSLLRSKLIKKYLKMMNIYSFFTTNRNETRAWLIKKGKNALDAAYLIHSQFKKGFIRAEIILYEDLVHFRSFDKIRKNAKIYLKGKNYIIKNNDIIKIRFNI